MTERQTLSFISKSLERAGLHPKTKYGQNFLIDLNLLDILVSGSDIQKTDVILEVGTGMGSLSKLMAPLAGAVVTVEIDRDLQALASKQLRDLECQRETGVVFLRLDGVDRLPRDAEFFGQVGLRPFAFGAQFFEEVFHLYLREM